MLSSFFFHSDSEKLFCFDLKYENFPKHRNAELWQAKAVIW